MTTVAGRAPAPDAPRAEWVEWASRGVYSGEPRVEPILVTGADGDVIYLDEATGPEGRPDGRPCAEPGCITRLSKYNIADRCFAHDRGPF